jgi:hypothetical protein
MGAGIAASPHCAERRICQISRSRSQGNLLQELRLTSSGVASHLIASSGGGTRRPYRGALVRRPASVSIHRAWPSQSHPMFRGPSWDGLVSRFASLTKDPKTSGSRVPRPKDHLFRRLFPAGSRKAPRGAFQLPAGGDRVLSHLPHLHSVSGFPMRPGPLSRSQLDSDSVFRVAPSEKYGCKPVDNVDIVQNPRNLFGSASTAVIEGQ